ncbi:hypothetical protein F2Q69_00049877 [Brassica cretica]|uniref:DEAD-box RNA helicase Q domain-containing protein n=1 Tax=Brassica cretica TaxID=69181 RepID=A0A8S9PNA8_BRACR|nr:hypothetical protein F2Q69_00049877 [Brassica cretica]
MMELDDDYVEYVPVAKLRAMEKQKILQRKGNVSAFEKEKVTESSKPSLLVQATQLKRDAPEVTATEHIILQEKEMLDRLSDKKTLMSVRELAKGITYTEPMTTGWEPLSYVRTMSRKQMDSIRKQWHVTVSGEEVPPLIKNFEDMMFDRPVLDTLKEKGIVQSTPIYRIALREKEKRRRISPEEGPIRLIICPSRELARQTYEVVEQFVGP